MDRWGPKHVELKLKCWLKLKCRNSWTCRVVRTVVPHTNVCKYSLYKTLLMMDRWGPKHVELTYVMNKTQSLKNFVYLVGVHIYDPSIFDIQKSCFPHTFFLCWLRSLQWTAVISLYCITWVIFVTDKKCVICEAGRSFLRHFKYMKPIYEQKFLGFPSFLCRTAP